MTFWRRIRGADNRTGHLLAWIGLGVLLVWLLPDALEWLGKAIERALPPPAAHAPPTVPQPQVDDGDSASPAKGEGADEQATPPPQILNGDTMDDAEDDETDDEEETAPQPPEETGPAETPPMPKQPM